MTRPDLYEQAYNLFRGEYARLFPAGGDAQDHDEAQRAAVDAVVALVAQQCGVTPKGVAR